MRWWMGLWVALAVGVPAGAEAGAKDTTAAVKVAEQHRLPKGAKAQAAKLQQVAALLKAGDQKKAAAAWKAFAKGYFKKGNVGDEAALVRWLVREAYLVKHPKAGSVVDRMRYLDEARKALRDCLAEQRELLTEIGKSRETACKVVVPPYRAGAVVQQSSASYDKKQLAASIAALEEQLATLGEDAQLANVDLQNVLQKQQQTVQMMSNISKQLHDTAMSVIKKIGG